MTTTLQIDLADIVEQKHPRGFHVPAALEVIEAVVKGAQQ